MPRIQLVQDKAARIDTMPRYKVMFDGVQFSELYFNLRGYVGYLPSPNPGGAAGHFAIGERPIGAYRKEVGILNKEWAALSKTV